MHPKPAEAHHVMQVEGMHAGREARENHAVLLFGLPIKATASGNPGAQLAHSRADRARLPSTSHPMWGELGSPALPVCT